MFSGPTNDKVVPKANAGAEVSATLGESQRISNQLCGVEVRRLDFSLKPNDNYLWHTTPLGIIHVQDNVADRWHLDSEVREFIRNHANSFIKWEVIQFFATHSSIAASATNLNVLLRHREGLLLSELEELLNSGFLVRDSGAFRIHPELISDSVFGGIFRKFLDLTQSQSGRMKIIFHILKFEKRMRKTDEEK
jgi:hypothetical protein